MPISAIQNRQRIGNHQQSIVCRDKTTHRLAPTLYLAPNPPPIIPPHIRQVNNSNQRLEKLPAPTLPRRHADIILPIILLLSQIRSTPALSVRTDTSPCLSTVIPPVSPTFESGLQRILAPERDPVALISPTRLLRLTTLNAASAGQGMDVSETQSPHSRPARYVLPPPTLTTTVAPSDDVKIAPLFNRNCSDNSAALSLSEILRQISKTLQKPITNMLLESKKVSYWLTGWGCLPSLEQQEIERQFTHVDTLISQLVTLLPGSNALAIAQYIVAPLLERAANDLDGEKPSTTQRAESLSLVQQLAQQARMSVVYVNHREKMQLREPLEPQRSAPLNLPTIHLIEGSNHIDLAFHKKIRRVPAIEHHGKVFALVSNKTHQRPRKYQVYFNYLRKKWEKMGNGRLNRFSTREQKIVSQYALALDYPHPPTSFQRFLPYTFTNPAHIQQDNISAIEMFGRLVPFHHDALTGETFIYDVSRPLTSRHRVTYWKNEWHLTLLPHNRIAYLAIYNAQKRTMMNMAVVKKINGHNLYAQVNPDTGVFWGKHYLLDENDCLVALTTWQKAHKHSLTAAREEQQAEHRLDSPELSSQHLIPCQRHKRGINWANPCLGKKYDSPLIGEGSISRVYDIGADYVIKKYQGKINQEYKSRLQYANNNARGFNRYYGEGSGFVSVTPQKDGSATVATRLKKISGISLNNIDRVQNKKLLTDMLLEISSKTLPNSLANILKEKGIIHYDINKGNIIYSQENGFSIIDFDSAVFSPDNQQVSQGLTEWMRNKFDYVLGDTRPDIFRQIAKLSPQA